MRAISIGAAVTSHTRWPSSRCIWASARVPGQIRWAIASSKISSPSSSSSATRVPGDERQRGVAGVGHVLGVLDADDPEVGLLPRGARRSPGGEELAAVQPAREVEDAGALHDRVVDVEERRRGRVAGRDERGLDLRGRPPRPRPRGRTLLQVEAPGPLGRGHPAQPSGAGRRRRRRACGRIASHAAPRHRRPAWPRLPPTSPTGRPSSRAGGRTLTWAELEDEVAPARRPVSARLGIRRRPARDDRRRQPHRVRDRLPRRPRPRSSPYRSTRVDAPASSPGCSPTPAAGWWSPTRPRSTPYAPRWPSSTAPDVARPRAGSSSPAPTPGEGELAFADLRADVVRPVPPLPDPEKLAALLYTSGTSRPAARGDAQPPGAAGQHRAGRGRRAADDARRRRGARGAAALPRLRPQRRARRGAAPPGAAGARRALRPAGARSTSSTTRRAASCPSRRPSSPTGCPTTPARAARAGAGSCCPGSAPLEGDGDRGVHRRSPASPCTRATA